MGCCSLLAQNAHVATTQNTAKTHIQITENTPPLFIAELFERFEDPHYALRRAGL